MSMASAEPEAHPVEPRLCILKADSVREALQGEHGDYPLMFRRLLVAAGWSARAIDERDVIADGPPPALEHQAYLITGSRFSVYDDEPWIAPLALFVGQALAARRKVVGICFGHQLLAHFFGGRVSKATEGWQVGVTQVAVQAQRGWMQPPAPTFAVLASHQDQVTALPSDARVLGSTEQCPVAAFELGACALAIQGHPEFEKPYSQALLDLRQTILGDAVYTAGQESLLQPTNGALLGQWIVQFLRQPPTELA
ncbi:MAG: hypothetical protein AAF648_07855 [Pseudomonadota bacterium]